MSRSSHRNGAGEATESQPLLGRITGHTISIHPDGESGRSGLHVGHFLKVLWRSSNAVSMGVNVLWPFVPVAIILHFVAPNLHLWIFALSYISMLPVANLLGFAGQEFARKMPKVTGILLETAFGSIVEIVLFIILIVKHTSNDGSAEHGNFIPIIQAAILGSILTNLLLCLGLCFFVGGIRQQIATFHAVVSEVGSGILLVAGFGLLVPSAFYSALKGAAVLKPDGSKHHQFTNEKLQHDVLRISQITSVLLIIAFFMSVTFVNHEQVKS